MTVKTNILVVSHMFHHIIEVRCIDSAHTSRIRLEFRHEDRAERRSASYSTPSSSLGMGSRTLTSGDTDSVVE